MLHSGRPGGTVTILNALWDSMTSDINEVMPPYAVSVRHADRSDSDLNSLFELVSNVFAEARRKHHLEVWFSVG